MVVYKNDETYLDALDPGTGALLWEVDTHDTYQPSYDNGRVYVVGSRGLVQAYNAEDGSTAWSIQQDRRSPSTATRRWRRAASSISPAAAAGVTLYSLDGKSGKRRWEASGPAGDSVPAVAGSTVFVTYPCNDYALRHQDRRLEMVYQTGCDARAAAARRSISTTASTINDGGNNVVLDATTGKPVHGFAGYQFPPAFWTPAGSGAPLGFVVDLSERCARSTRRRATRPGASSATTSRCRRWSSTTRW